MAYHAEVIWRYVMYEGVTKNMKHLRFLGWIRKRIEGTRCNICKSEVYEKSEETS